MMAFAVIENRWVHLLPYLHKWTNNRSFTCSSYVCAKISIFKQLNLPEPPKRPLHPILKYTGSLQDLGKGLSAKDRSRVKTDKWESLPKDEKAEYIKSYDTAFKEYKNQHATYLSTLTDDQLEQIKHRKIQNAYERSLKQMNAKQRQNDKEDFANLGKPKRPMTSFLLFLETVEKEKRVPFKEFWIKVGQQWQALSEEGRLKYKMEAQERMKVYIEELCQWEQTMVKRGRFDVVRKSTLRTLTNREDSQTIETVPRSSHRK